jgi:hypothetical protein
MKSTAWIRHINRFINLLGFTLLAGIIIYLMFSTIIEAWKSHSIGGIFMLIVVIGSIIAIYHEGKSLAYLRNMQAQNQAKRIVFEFIAVFAGGILAYFFSQDIGLGPVVAAGLVGILAYLIIPGLGAPVYCGAFVGMTSEILLFNHLEVAIASLITALVFILARNVFVGVGGKLGAMALIGTSIAGFGLGRNFLFTPVSDWKTNALVILIALIAAPLTYYFNRHRENGPVLASSVVGLAAGLILPTLFPLNGNTFAVVAICASFTGMTSTERCPNFWHMSAAGLFTGIIFVFSAPLLGGAGGKLGTIAFGSVLSACGYSRIGKWIKNRTEDRRQETEE